MFLSSLFVLQDRMTVVFGRIEQRTIKTVEDVENLGFTQV
jgi:translation elongation factor EF-Tu-like GTPase